MTQIGDLNKQITLQIQTKSSDGMGGFTVTWNDWDTVWAKMTTHRSDDSIQAMRQTGMSLHNFRIRYRKNISPSMRIKYGDRYMAIVGPPIEIDGGGGRHWLDITVEEAI